MVRDLTLRACLRVDIQALRCKDRTFHTAPSTTCEATLLCALAFRVQNPYAASRWLKSVVPVLPMNQVPLDLAGVKGPGVRV